MSAFIEAIRREAERRTEQGAGGARYSRSEREDLVRYHEAEIAGELFVLIAAHFPNRMSV